MFLRRRIAPVFILLFLFSGISSEVSAEAKSLLAGPPCPNFVGSPRIEVEDLILVAADWHKPNFNPNSDLDGDRKVTVKDLVLVALKFGQTCSPATIFGVTFGEGDPEREQMAFNAGAEWYRIIVHWDSIEPENNRQYNWSRYDGIIRGLRERGLHPLVELRGIPDWALVPGEPNCGLMSASGLQAYSDFLTAIVERYDGDGINDASESPRVIYWEIGNEVDKTRSFTHYGLCYGDHPDAYAELLARSWDAIKSADPTGQVVFGGLAYENCCDFNSDPLGTGKDFLDLVLEYIESHKASRDPKTYFDVMNVHAYQWFLKNFGYNPPDVRTKYEKVRLALLTHCPSCGLVPLMNTEGGRRDDVVIYEQGSSLDYQAAYVPILYVRSMAYTGLEIKAVFWFAMMDFDNKGYGLVNETNSPKPAYWAYKTLTHELEGFEYDPVKSAAINLPALVEGHVFSNSDGDEKWVVFVPPQHAGVTQNVSLPFSKVKVTQYDKYSSIYSTGGGDPSKEQILCGNGSVNLTATNFPVYIEPNPTASCPTS